MRRAVVLLFALAVGFGGLSHSLAGEEPDRGRRLSAVLEELRAQGLRLVYSSAVVTDDMVVVAVPNSGSPGARLGAILAPFGLEARDGPAGSILIVRSAAAAGVAAAASGKPPPVRTSYVENVEVTPGKLSVVQQELGTTVSIADADLVLVPVSGGDAARVVATLPGVTAPDNSAAFGIRGGLPRDVALVFDGLELYEPFHLSELQSPFSYLDSGIVDRIDLYAGGPTVDFGDRHGGLVAISTRPPQRPSAALVQVGTLKSGAALSGPLGNGSWLMTGRFWYPETVRRVSELGRDGLDPRFGDIYAKGVFPATARTEISAHALAAYDALQFVELDGAERLSYRSHSTYGWLRASTVLSPRLRWHVLASAGRIQRTRKGVSEPEDLALELEDRRGVRIVGLRQDLSWEISEAQHLRAGVAAQRAMASYAYALTEPGGGRTDQRKPRGSSIGAYLAHRAAWRPGFATEFGMRWDHQSHTGDAQWSPRVHAVWRASDRTEIRLGVGRFSQSQRIHELAIEDGETEFSPAERCSQAELDWEQEFPHAVTLRISGYTRRLSRVRPRHENLFNPIELFPETEADRVRIEPTRARLRGVELFLRGDPARPVRWWASYTRSSARDEIDGTDVARSWDQAHTVKGLLGRDWGGRWSGSLSASARTGWPTTPVTAESRLLPDGSTEVVALPGRRNSDRFPWYFRLDARVGRSFSTKRGRLRLELDIANLTDRRNVCCVDEFQLAERADGSVDVHRELVTWLGITPAFSVAWEVAP
jgi:outer membrane receptor protein involved in Fe transport